MLLADLPSATDYVSIELVDDAAAHKEDDTVIATAQAKHSISSSGTTFEDTSYALWRTIELWISKLEVASFTTQTAFYCTTNKEIPPGTLLRRLKDASTYEEAALIIESLLEMQQQKLARWKRTTGPKSRGMADIVGLIKYALSKPAELKILWTNLNIEDNADFKLAFLNKIHVVTPSVTPYQRSRIYEECYGWIVITCLAKWRNSKAATISKEQFNNKLHIILNSPAIVKAIFRTKKSIGEIGEKEMINRQHELFVRQIEEIEWRQDVKERKVRTAILEFIYHEIELKYVIDKGDYTAPDFDIFLKTCRDAWQRIFDRHFPLELEKYTPAERHDIARTIFDNIMNDLQLEFKDGFCFTTDNAYMRNGSFLKLSNIPTIGWHPEWEAKYK